MIAVAVGDLLLLEGGVRARVVEEAGHQKWRAYAHATKTVILVEERDVVVVLPLAREIELLVVH